MTEHDHDHGYERDHQHSRQVDPTEVRFTEQFWDERYRSAPSIWSGNVNRHLVSQASGLTPGEALDVGCGEGADALWLARQGWRVLAVDWSVVALERGAEYAAADLAGAQISWEQQDLAGWDPGSDRFDLVSSQFFHLPGTDRDALFVRLAAAVRHGGTLLIVGHHPHDLQTSMPRPDHPDLFYTGDQIAALLDPDVWTVVTNEAVGREVPDPDGIMITIHDAVFRAERRG